MDYLEFLSTITDSKTARILLMISSTLFSGLLIIYYFNKHDFYNLSTSKLILLSLIITVPIFMVNMAMTTFQKSISEIINMEEKIGFVLVSAGIFTSINIYYAIAMCYFNKSNLSSFINNIFRYEVLYFIFSIINLSIQIYRKHRKTNLENSSVEE